MVVKSEQEAGRGEMKLTSMWCLVAAAAFGACVCTLYAMGYKNHLAYSGMKGSEDREERGEGGHDL